MSESGGRVLAFDSIVIGGGLGGVAVALALARHGIAVHVLEQATSLGELGAGIQLGPNASRVLDTLGVLERVVEDAVFPPEAVLMDAVTGQRLTALRFDEGFRRSYGYLYFVTHRSDLHRSLLEAAMATGQVTFETDRRVTGIDQHDDLVELLTADGSRYQARAVIGADGLHSVARSYVVGDGEPVFSGDIAYRGTLAYDDVSERAGKDNMTWWVGPKMHLVQYPIRRRELFNQVAVFTSDRPPDAPHDAAALAELDARFADKCDIVRRGGQSILRDRRWLLVDRPPVSTWTVGRVTLLGDAAHPMLQYLGQGCCQAFEDAVALADALASYGPAQAPDAFQAYERDRIPRTAMVQTWARRVGQIVHSDGVTALLRNALLKDRGDDDLAYFNWLYAPQPSSLAVHGG